MTTLRINGMGAAIPMALSLSLAIRDALSGGEESDGNIQAVKMEVRTGSIDVGDEITPLRHVSNKHQTHEFLDCANVFSLNFPFCSLYI